MLDGVPIGGLLDGASTVAVVVLFGWALATGRLVTRREHTERVTDLRAQMLDKTTEAKTWQEAARVSADQTDRLGAIGQQQVAIMESIRTLAAGRAAP